MKFFANIPTFLMFLMSVPTLSKYAGKIRDARRRGDLKAEAKFIRDAEDYWGQHIMDKLGAKLHVEGEENMPEEGPFVIIANHQGYADIFTCITLTKHVPLGFIAKYELSKLPIFGKFITDIRSVFIHRGDHRESLKAINEGVENVKKGFSMAIFPEGTRSNGQLPAPFMKGSLKLATKPGVPIVPVSIHGTYKMLEQDGYFHGADVYAKVHEPIPTAGISRRQEKELADQVEKIVVNGVIDLMIQTGDLSERPEI